jgi:nitrite reductase/ring-hydroxylating ferredoxin subunit
MRGSGQATPSIEPADFPTNRGGLCAKGWSAPELLDHPHRLTTPLVRADPTDPTSPLRPSSWDQALGHIVAAIRRSQDVYGRDSVGCFGGGGLTNEKAYQLGKFARVALRTSNIDYNGRFWRWGCPVSRSPGTAPSPVRATGRVVGSMGRRPTSFLGTGASTTKPRVRTSPQCGASTRTSYPAPACRRWRCSAGWVPTAGSAPCWSSRRTSSCPRRTATGCSAGCGRMTTTMADYRLGAVDDLPLGEGRAYSAGEHTVAVFRLRDGSLYAVSAICPHAGGPIADGLVDARIVICPLHQHVYELATGCSRSGQPSLRVYPIRIDDGQLVLSVPVGAPASA